MHSHTAAAFAPPRKSVSSYLSVCVGAGRVFEPSVAPHHGLTALRAQVDAHVAWLADAVPLAAVENLFPPVRQATDRAGERVPQHAGRR